MSLNVLREKYLETEGPNSLMRLKSTLSAGHLTNATRSLKGLPGGHVSIYHCSGLSCGGGFRALWCGEMPDLLRFRTYVFDQWLSLCIR
jgi:hypothetical protein